MDQNPYQAPALASFEQVPVPGGELAAIRQKHLSTEASIKSLGILYFLGVIFLIPVGLLVCAGAISGSRMEIGLAQGILFLSVGVLNIFLGIAIRKLKPWARIVAAILTVPGLIGFPIGTLICGYILYLLLGKKGSMVFSPYYKEVIAATPGMKYKTSIVVWIILAVLLALILGGVGLAFLRGYQAARH